MPELAELAIASEFVDNWSFTKGRRLVQFTKIEKSPESKINTDFSFLHSIVEKEGAFALHSSTSRGKEMMIRFSSFKSVDTPFEDGLLINLGMSGNWIVKCVADDKKNELEPPKHGHLRLSGEFLENGIIYHLLLVLHDPRRFAKWKWAKTYSANRSPDPVKEHSDFRTNFERVMMTNPNLRDRAILDLMMNQSIMNGIGNYLRCEILYRADINPFSALKDLQDAEIKKILDLCKTVPSEAYQLGGGQLKQWKNENGVDAKNFREWMKSYQKGAWILDESNRKFWFDPKWKETQEYKAYAERSAKLKMKREKPA
jgi:formamidopyrimidine-DNA glycosylase